MKIFLTATALFLLLNISASTILAEDSTSSPTIKRKIPLETRIVKLDSLQEKMASRAATLRTKLASFRDKKKASAAAKVNENLARVNKFRTTETLAHLDRLSNILDRLETRVNGVTDKDTSNAKSAIVSTRAAINSARIAVTLQSEKDYTIIITTESKVRTDATTQRQQLHTDLKSVFDSVVLARQLLSAAISQSAQLGGLGNGQ